MRVSMPLVAAATLLAILIAIYGPGIGKGFVKTMSCGWGPIT